MNYSAISLSWGEPGAASARANLAVLARGRMSFAASSVGDKWRTHMPHLIEAALMTELATVCSGDLDAALVWVPYHALSEFLRRMEQIRLMPAVVSCAHDELADHTGFEDVIGNELQKFMVFQLKITAGGESAQMHDSAAVPRAVDSDSSGADVATARMPDCCMRAWVKAAAAGFTDPLAAVLAREKSGPLLAFTALAVLGISPLRHPPCSLNCSDSVQLVEAFIERAQKLGYVHAAQVWEQIAKLTINASVRSGLAEVKSDGFRFTYWSDVAAGGVAMPAAEIAKRWHILPALQKLPPKPTASAQFSNEFARRSRCNTVAWEQAGTLQRATGVVAHFGCGDGLLLEILSQMKPAVKLLGMDADILLTQAAAARPALASAAIETCDWLALLNTRSGIEKVADLIFVDPEPLADLPEERRKFLGDRLCYSANTIVIIATERSLRRFGEIEALAKTCGFELVAGRRNRVSACLAKAAATAVGGLRST